MTRLLVLISAALGGLLDIQDPGVLELPRYALTDGSLELPRIRVVDAGDLKLPRMQVYDAGSVRLPDVRVTAHWVDDSREWLDEQVENADLVVAEAHARLPRLRTRWMTVHVPTVSFEDPSATEATELTWQDGARLARNEAHPIRR